MKNIHSSWTCFTRCPINYFGIFLSFIVEVMLVPLFLLSNTPLTLLATFVLLYILYVQIKLYTDIIKKCHDIIETNKVPTSYCNKRGEQLYNYTNYPLWTILLLVIPAIIIGTFLMASII